MSGERLATSALSLLALCVTACNQDASRSADAISAPREIVPAAEAKAPAPPTSPTRQLTEFGSIPLCSPLAALPDDAAPLGESCKPDDAVKGCRFASAGDAGRVEYQVLGGTVRAKAVVLEPGVPGPFGLSDTDDAAIASAKVRRATGLALTRFEDEAGAYLQSEEQPCPGNAYRLVIELTNGRASRVMLTTLPAV